MQPHPGNIPSSHVSMSQPPPEDNGGTTTLLPPDPMMMQYPLKDISVPHPHDVLCGRGECLVCLFGFPFSLDLSMRVAALSLMMYVCTE